METVKLRNGTEEAAPLVATVMMSINGLMEEGLPGMLAVYDLAEVCKGKGYKPFGNNLKKLQDLNLLDQSGRPHDSLKNIVLSAVQGEGMDMTVVSPLDPSVKREAPVAQEKSDLDKKAYFDRVAKIGQFILNESNKDGNWLDDRLKDTINSGTNPYHSVIQADGSLLLESYYGQPNKFHTPLGEFDFGGSSSGDKTALVEMLKEKLGLVEVVPERHSNMGTHGPIYAVTKDLDGKPFPMPQMPLKKIKLDYEAAKKEWDEVKPDLEAIRAAVPSTKLDETAAEKAIDTPKEQRK